MRTPIPAVTPHLLIRLVWNCLRCGEPWLSSVVRGQFAAEFESRRAHLLCCMAPRVDDFTIDLMEQGIQPDAGQACLRFIDWIRPATAPVAA